MKGSKLLKKHTWTEARKEDELPCEAVYGDWVTCDGPLGHDLAHAVHSGSGCLLRSWEDGETAPKVKEDIQALYDNPDIHAKAHLTFQKAMTQEWKAVKKAMIADLYKPIYGENPMPKKVKKWTPEVGMWVERTEGCAFNAKKGQKAQVIAVFLNGCIGSHHPSVQVKVQELDKEVSWHIAKCKPVFTPGGDPVLEKLLLEEEAIYTAMHETPQPQAHFTTLNAAAIKALANDKAKWLAGTHSVQMGKYPALTPNHSPMPGHPTLATWFKEWKSRCRAHFPNGGYSAQWEQEYYKDIVVFTCWVDGMLVKSVKVAGNVIHGHPNHIYASQTFKALGA